MWEPLSGLPRPQPVPSTCEEVWRERRGPEVGLCAALAGQREFRRARARWVPTLGATSPRCQARVVRGLATGPAAAAVAPGPSALPALGSNSCWASAASPRSRAQDLPPPCPSPRFSALGSRAAQASRTGAAPCSVTPSPITHPRAEEYRCTVQDWQATPPAAQVRDPLGLHETTPVKYRCGDIQESPKQCKDMIPRRAKASAPSFIPTTTTSFPLYKHSV
uniref:uncharacterized protein LOC114677388 n=1 Tax=Macaca mulatta TaxID=9544 RepID=UPI0010A25195|nr:uncharacterized protein LOC114677388 [Macaca mulatta]